MSEIYGNFEVKKGNVHSPAKSTRKIAESGGRQWRAGFSEDAAKETASASALVKEFLCLDPFGHILCN